MKRIQCLQLFIVVIGILLCIIGHNGAKKYILKLKSNNISNTVVYNNYSNISFNYSSITTEPIITTESISTTTSTTKIFKTTTKTSTLLTKTTKEIDAFKNEVLKEEIIKDDGEVIYDDMTLTELTNKLNKNLSSTLTNTGHYFANYYKKTGLDPYLAVAIVLHETGCKWTCSKLVRECNNIGGIKGSPKCNGGSYKKYDSLEEGINGYLDMLYNNYYSKGLTTPELINPKYAASTTWSEKINNYIDELKK